MGVTVVFNERIGILRSGNVISPKVEEQVRAVIFRLEDRWQLSLTEEKGGRLVTHLAMALARIEKGDEISAPEEDQLGEFRSLSVFEEAVKIVEDIIEFAPITLPEAEKGYMILNICLILDDIE